MRRSGVTRIMLLIALVACGLPSRSLAPHEVAELRECVSDEDCVVMQIDVCDCTQSAVNGEHESRLRSRRERGGNPACGACATTNVPHHEPICRASQCYALPVLPPMDESGWDACSTADQCVAVPYGCTNQPLAVNLESLHDYESFLGQQSAAMHCVAQMQRAWGRLEAMRSCPEELPSELPDGSPVDVCRESPRMACESGHCRANAR